MRLAVLSGKGGTGKTFVSVNLAAVLDQALYLDCDVEAPNGRLFFKPEGVKVTPVKVKMPRVTHDLCTGCRLCTDFCKFNAMAYVNGQVKIFEDICHSCGGCSLLCPTGAITEIDFPIGRIESGYSEGSHIESGILSIGEASGVPIIASMIRDSRTHEGNLVIDCPPGSACVVMESIKEVDHCLVVAEPTLFGAHNCAMVLELTHEMSLPTSVIINKSIGDDQLIYDVCEEMNVAVIASIPFERSLGEINGNGFIAARMNGHYEKLFRDIAKTLNREVSDEAIINS